MRLYPIVIRLWTICILALLPLGFIIADDKAIIEKECVNDRIQCEDEYENHLKKKNNKKSFFRRELTKRRAYPYIDKAFAFLANDNLQSAISELDKYLAVDPTHELVRWYRLVMASMHEDSSKTIEIASNFIEQVEESGPALLIRGNSYIKVGKIEKAERDFILARSKSLYDHAKPENITWILFNLAYNQSDYKNARKWLDELPITEKNSPRYMAARANILEKTGQQDEAINSWKNLLTTSHKEEQKVRALTALGRLHEKQGNNTEALGYYIKVLGLTDNDQIRLNAAEIAWRMKDYRKAQLLLEPIIKDKNASKNTKVTLKALKALGRVHEKKSEHELAFRYYSKALKIEEDTPTRLNAAETAWTLQYYKNTQWLLEPLIQTGTLDDEQALGLRQRYCEAIEKSGDEERALSCFNKLYTDNPTQLSLLSYSANLAHRRGNNDIYLQKLKKLYSLEPSAKTASSIGYALEKNKQWEDAESWHKTAYSTDTKPEYAVAYAGSLLGNKKPKVAKEVLLHIIKAPDSTPEQREYAYNNLASIYFYNKSYREADTAWKNASKERDTPVYTLRRIVTNNISGNHDIAYQLASPYGIDLPNNLSTEYHQDWYAAIGETYYKNKDYKNSQGVFEKLSKLKPTADYYLSLAESYRAHGDYELSNIAYLKAESLSTKKGNTLKARAYMYLQAGMEDKAMPLLKKVHAEDPSDALISENLGYYSLKKNQNTEAANYFKQALERYEEDKKSNENTEKTREKQENLTQLISALEKRWSLSLFDGLCIGSSACEAGNQGLISPFGQGFGQGKIGYQYNSSLSIISRGLWRNKKDSLAVDRRSFQPTLGVELQPVKDSNLLLSAEYMFEGGPDTENHVLLRSAWSMTKGNNWSLKDSHEKKGFNLKDYTNLYADLGKLFINNDPYLIYAEGRKGKTAIFSRQSLVSGFGYLRGSAEFNDHDKDQHVIDAGIGIEGRYRNLYDRYQGYKLEWNTLLRMGHELDNSMDKEDLRVNLGIGLRY